jgi:hypothetical protein
MLSILLVIVGIASVVMGAKALTTKRIQYRRVVEDSEGNPLQSDSLEGRAAVGAGILCLAIGVASISFGVLLGIGFIG